MSNFHVTDLFCDTVDVKPRMVDWRELLGEDLEGWQSFEAVECHECQRDVVLNALGEEEHRHIEPDIEDEEGFEVRNDCTGYLCSEGPAMNFFYECDFGRRGFTAEEAAQAVAHLPVCIVEMRDGETGFALTGGGMDLSWEICEAYMCLGYLPPFHFCSSLPNMAGKRLDRRTAAVIDACKRSVDAMANWVENARSRLAGLEHILRAESICDGASE